MTKNKTLASTDAFAKEYDDHIQTKTWFAPGVIFGLLYEHIQPGEALLDVGIGTGLSALPFYKAGLEIYGVDGSAEMIKICRSKNFVRELKEVDLTRFTPPLFNRRFDIVISVGVFHFLENLYPLIREISHRLKRGGLFGFTTFRFEPEEGNGFEPASVEGVFLKNVPHLDFPMYQHTPSHITHLLADHGFTLIWNE